MRPWHILFFLAACGESSDFTKSDVDKAYVSKDYERTCRGVRAEEDEVRAYAASKLSTVKDSIATDCVCEAMDNGAGGWDEAILQGLKESDSESLAACFGALVEKPDLTNRAAAITALATLRSASATTTLATLLSDDSLEAYVRVGIIESLPRRADDTALLLGLIAGGGDLSLRAAAATKLSADAYPEEDIRAALINAAGSDGEGEARIAAIGSLRAREFKGAKVAIRDAVSDDDQTIRAGVFQLLSGTQDEFEVNQLVRAAEREQDSPDTRIALLAALQTSGKAGSDDAKTVLCEAIPFWIETYLDSETHLDKIPEGIDIIWAQNEADYKLTQPCLEDIIKNKTSRMSCFGDYYLKHWYADHILERDMDALGTEKEVRFNLKLDHSYSYQLKFCE